MREFFLLDSLVNMVFQDAFEQLIPLCYNGPLRIVNHVKRLRRMSDIIRLSIYRQSLLYKRFFSLS